jgi:hypothetical protein
MSGVWLRDKIRRDRSNGGRGSDGRRTLWEGRYPKGWSMVSWVYTTPFVYGSRTLFSEPLVQITHIWEKFQIRAPDPCKQSRSYRPLSAGFCPFHPRTSRLRMRDFLATLRTLGPPFKKSISFAILDRIGPRSDGSERGRKGHGRMRSSTKCREDVSRNTYYHQAPTLFSKTTGPNHPYLGEVSDPSHRSV